jgi:general secretion pathway protein C
VVLYSLAHAASGVAAWYVTAEVPDLDGAGADKDEGDDGDEEDDARSRTTTRPATRPSTRARTTTAAKKEKVGERFDFNPFCPQCVPPTKADSDDPYGVAEGGAVAQFGGEVETSLPLTLVATMEATAPGISVATIRIGEEADGVTGLFEAGDEVLDDVELVEVESGVVHLLASGRREYLKVRIPGEVKKPKAPTAPTPTAKARAKSKYEIDGAADAIKCNGTSCTVEKAFVEMLIAKPSLLIQQGSARPYKRDELEGVRLSRVRRGTIPRLLGMRSGDVLTSVNGQSLATMDNAMGLYSKLRTAKHLTVDLTRSLSGERKNMTLEIDII